MNKRSNIHLWFAGAAIILIVIISGYISHYLNQTPKINFVQAKKADITQGVNVDGTVVSAQDLSLAFEQGGMVTQVAVKAGDTVKKGQVLVSLDNKSSAAAVNQAKAALDAASANYEKILNGATGADINVAKSAVSSAQTALDNAQKNQTATIAQQKLAVSNALLALTNSALAATPGTNNLSSQNPVITGTYTGSEQGQYKISLYSTGSGLHFNFSGLESGSGEVTPGVPTALGNLGLFIQFSSGQVSANDNWTVNIPNTKAANYLVNLNAYNAALQTQNQALTGAQAAVDSASAALNQAQSALQLKETAARPEDIASAKAQIEAAEAQLQTAQNTYGKASLISPIDGLVTNVSVKVGQTVPGSTMTQNPAAVKIISNQKFQVETYITEADIGKIKVGDKAEVILDAYGSGVNFDANVISIDPAATIKNGVSTYKTTLEFNQNDDRIKTGMGGSVIISDQKHENVLSIPSSSIIKKSDQSFVLTDDGSGKIIQTTVKTGVSGLDGTVEILSGLSEGQKVAYFGNN